MIKMLSKSILFKWSVNEKCFIILTGVHFFKDGNERDLVLFIFFGDIVRL